MIKVLHVITDTNIGGAGVWLLNYLRYYDRNETELSVIVPENSALIPRIEALGVRVTALPSIADVSYSSSAVKVLREAIKKEAPDIVHTHACLSARIAAKKLKIKVINTRHCIEEKKSGIKAFAAGFINKRLSDKVIAVSMAVYDNLIEEGISADKIVLIYNGVPALKKLPSETVSDLRKKLGYEGKFVFGIFARLEKVKNISLFLRAASAAYEKNPSLRFLVAGNGSLSETLKSEAASLGIEEAVTFTGYIEDITEMMNAVDVDVLTSDSEALSISLIEGMTIGKPCITTDSGGPAEVVSNGDSGIVVPVGDAGRLADAMLSLASDKDLYEKYSSSSELIARAKFSPEEMSEKLTLLYKEAMLGKEITK